MMKSFLEKLDMLKKHPYTSPTRGQQSGEGRKKTKPKKAREDVRKAMSEAHKGKRHSEESRIKMSAAMQGIPIEEWDGFAAEQKYCYKFNASCRAQNREKYNHECFMCGKHEDNQSRKLSVHYVDMSKSQGCEGEGWKLVPLCQSCHPRAHNPIWRARIEYLLMHRVYMNVR